MLTRTLGDAKSFCDRCRARASSAWFRGHAQTGWYLKSTLQRHVENFISNLDATLSGEERRWLLCNEGQSTYRLFLNDALPLLKAIERDEWGVIFTMQHYGLPTRLLDWTESFACALYFAHRERKPDQPITIWALDPQGLNQIALGGHGVVALDEGGSGKATIDVRSWHPRYVSQAGELPTIAVAPDFTNARMTAQRAAFTLMGDSFLSLDQQFEGRLVKDGYLTRIEILPEAFEEAEAYLHLAGCSAFTFFPDMDGLARRHKDEAASMIRDAKKIWPHLMKKDGN